VSTSTNDIETVNATSDRDQHNVPAGVATSVATGMVVPLGQESSDLSSCNNSSVVEEIMCAVAGSTATTPPVIMGAVPGSILTAAPFVRGAVAASTLAAALEGTVAKVTTLSIKPSGTTRKSILKKCKKKDVAVEIEDSFLTYMESVETRKQANKGTLQTQHGYRKAGVRQNQHVYMGRQMRRAPVQPGTL